MSQKRKKESKKRQLKHNCTENSEENITEKIGERLGRDFFDIPCLELATALLGKLLVTKLETGLILKGRIVETEAYPGGEDKASRTCGERCTKTNEPLYKDPGTAFVYLTYGMYHCFNIHSKEPGSGVLLRALEPVEGVEEMCSRRIEKTKSKLHITEKNLCNGPSKLCISMGINKIDFNAVDMCTSEKLWIEDGFKEMVIVKSTRIGIDKVEKDWRLKPWRFYLYKNPNISKIDKEAEKEFEISQ